MSIPIHKGKINDCKASTSTTIVCYKCGKNCDVLSNIITARCTKCNDRYEFDCIGLSEKNISYHGQKLEMHFLFTKTK